VNPFLAIAREILFGLPLVVVTPPMCYLFWIVVVLVWYQYRRMARSEQQLHGFTGNDPVGHTLSAVVYGLLAGLLGSMILISLGVPLQRHDIITLWPVALGLMLFSPRLLCFSYAGSLVALSNLLFGWPQVNVAGIVGLVAILHMMEGLLVAASGASAVMPVYVRTPRGRVVGAFTMQRFWPIPVMIILLISGQGQPPGGISMPGWWPLIGAPGAAGSDVIHLMLPVVAALGYSDIALTVTPRDKARRSARHLFFYSTVLLALSIGAAHSVGMAWVAAAFAGLGHETMVFFGGRGELWGRPLFVPPSRGIRILYVLEESLARRVGLTSGDTVLRVNGLEIADRDELHAALPQDHGHLELEVRGLNGEERVLETDRYDPAQKLGIMLVPQPSDTPHIRVGRTGLFFRMIEWLRARFRR